MLTPTIENAARALRLTINGLSEPVRRNGVELFPALAYFTFDDPSLPAHGATFAVKLPELTTETLESHAIQTAASFA